MRLSYFSQLLTFFFIYFGTFTVQIYAQNPFNCDTIKYQSKPWGRWWWFGSSVNESEISRQLQELKRVGFGGVEIQPIYAEKDSPIEPIPYLSRRWAEVFLFTLQEAQRLGLGVDLTLGSGWPFGGPWLKSANAARKLDVLEYEYNENNKSHQIIDDSVNPIECIVITPLKNSSSNAQILDFSVLNSTKVWTIPSGNWKVYVIKIGYTGQQVKRATIGSEGPVLDHFLKTAFENYVEPFNAMFGQIGQMRPRCNFNDSYEVYGANATPELFAVFQKIQGYDLRKYVPVLIDSTNLQIRRKILHDYRETIYSLYLNQFCFPWVEWSHKNRMQIRFQAHGAPGNLIDLYGLADIPETEGFGRGGIDVLVGKFASSGAHLYGRELCSAEIFTWLDEHFHVNLDMMRRSVDYFFLAGINHVFYHGLPFSQPKDPFPGPVFYASTHVGETNTWWHHVHYLNEYIARIQSALQSHSFDSDVLVYFPIHDMWSYSPGAQNLLQLCEVQNAKDWLQGAASLTWKAANMLQENGWQFDYVSDKIITESVKAENNELIVNKYRYKAMIISGVHNIEEGTLQKIQRLVEQGINIIFVNNIPRIVERNSPDNQGRTPEKNEYEDYFKHYVNKSVFIVNSVEELSTLLGSLKIRNESFSGDGLKFIRLKNSNDIVYFLKNTTNNRIEKWIDINCSGNTVLIANPLTGKIGKTGFRKENLTTKVHITIDPQGTLLLSVNEHDNSAYSNFEVIGEPVKEIKLTGQWRLSWQDYDNNPHIKTITQLEPWTKWQQTQYYSGEIKYQTTFTISNEESGKKCMLDVGEIHESAEIYVNGIFGGAVWTIPYTLDISDKIRAGENTIQIRVRNLMANRMIHLDRTGVKWRKYFFVNINYKPFDASQWILLPSGLIGPVCIIISQRKNNKVRAY